MGRLLNTHQQLCMAHGLQFAVSDVVYKPASSTSNSNASNSSNSATINTSTSYAAAIDNSATATNITGGSNADDSEDDDDHDDDDDDGFTSSLPKISIQIAHKDLAVIVGKVRQVVKIFKKSPTKNDTYLQPYILTATGTTMSLQLDCKSRWSSMHTMLEIFLRVFQCIRKALWDMGDKISFTDSEITILEQARDALSPVKLAIETLGGRDANLITSDAVIGFVLNTLAGSISGSISDQIYNAVQSRFKQRRTKMSSVLQYLHGVEQRDNLFGVGPGRGV